MSPLNLKYKPLIEAIFEVKWRLVGSSPGPQTDPHYKLLLARLYDRLNEDYPEHEQLPTASMPDEIMGHVVQHRFRVARDSWPLLQIGPGIFTANSTTDDYTSTDFSARVKSATEWLYDAYPKPEDLVISSLVLRYINAVGFDFSAENAFGFLKEQMKINVSLPTSLFEDTGVEEEPVGFTLHSSYRCDEPSGRISVRFGRGQKDNLPAIIWETTVESAGEDVPELPNGFEDWFDAAHDITEDWFFKLIEGDLQRRFSGE